jgi:hypothetical protein
MNEQKPKPDAPESRKDEQQPRKDALLLSIKEPKCDLCGSRMIEWHCRMMCPSCGYQRDCSDP